MARRRKKSKAAAQAKQREKDASPMITDKSLPALPPNAVPPSALSSGDRVTHDSDTPTELSPRPRAAYGRNDSSSRSGSRADRSPERPQDPSKESNLAPSTQGYRHNRNSTMLSADLNSGDSEGFFIPVALDPSPAPSLTPQSMSDTFAESSRRNKDRDYFTAPKPSAATEKRADSQASTPHIAFQEKGRQPSSDYDTPQNDRPVRKLSKRNGNPRASPSGADERKASSSRTQPGEEFKLQDAPKSKRLANSRSNSLSGNPQDMPVPAKAPSAPPRNRDAQPKATNPDSPPRSGQVDKGPPPRSSQDFRQRDDDVARPSLDSVATGRSEAPGAKPAARMEAPQSSSRNGKLIIRDSHKRTGRTNRLVLVNGNESGPQTRPAMPETKLTDTYMSPRAPPQPPIQASKEPVSAAGEAPEPRSSPKLPRWSAGGDFSMDEDMARILGTDEGSSSIMRRVSNAVRHGRTNSTDAGNNHGRLGHSRSVSETTRGTASPRWPRTPIAEDPANGGHIPDISSPISLSGTGQEDPAFLKRQLRNSEQRVAELERQFNTEKDLKNLNKKLIEKRKTVSVLDTQTEIMIRQIEVLAKYVERAKKTGEPIDPRELEESAIKEFVQKLDKVKQSMAATIEQLHAERDELLEEKNQAIADRDRALLEFEQLSSKNAQLADMNNDLTHQIQERFKQQIANGDLRAPPNGLGIYSHAKGISTASVNVDAASLQTGSTMVGPDAEEPVLEGPTVVNIRKGQVVKKFNWKKGSSKVAHNITKGINRAAGAFQQQDQTRLQSPQGLGGDSIGIPYNMTVAQVESPVTMVPPSGPTRAATEGSRQGFGFFSSKKPNVPKSTSVTNVSATMPPAAEAPSTLFGSDLVERADFERRQIPSVVTRCIEEVELRGMDIEGIYRKTGGNSQVKMIQEGFDKQEDFDISDPALDITAVTSVLKQYFRKLPNPLLTFEVYERVLESNCEFFLLFGCFLRGCGEK